MDHPKVFIDPKIMGGKACIKGTRLPVTTIIDYLASGDTIEQVLEGYPFIGRDDVLAALAYASDFLKHDGVVAA